MRKALVLGYGAFAYLFTMASFAFCGFWIVNLSFMPVTIDGGTPLPTAQAVLINSLLMIGFGLHHSFFARTSLKKIMRRFIPKNLERITYCLTSAVLLFAFCFLWEPMPAPVWTITAPAGAWLMYGLLLFFTAVHFFSIYKIDHNDFFGLRQVGLEARGEPYTPMPPVSEQYYMVWHVVLALSLAILPFFTPEMSVGHLFMAVVWFTYTGFGAWLSHRDPGDVQVESESAQAQPVPVEEPLPAYPGAA